MTQMTHSGVMATPSHVPQQEEHPALAALRLAPLDDEPVTEADLRAMASARCDLAAGLTVSDAQLCADLGLKP